ncbi:hypothetical protein DL770_009022 [Monosporascus sp. CRB-9-2]|nr:hypothetical protein DL770_009022 [Monosporascus sp. CRB-9-2]
MATIEPRLIHLLNESTATPRPHHAELPSIKGLSLPPGRPHPIEPDAGRRSDGTDANGGQLATQQPRPSPYPVGGDEGSATATAGQRRENASSYTADRTLLSHISSQDLRMILDDTPDCTEDPTTKKRPSKEDFVQLPQPLKKQKSGTQQHVFPPIIVGLLEPPLNVALFPPISSGSFDDRPHSEPPQALNITKAPEIQTGPEDKHVPSPSPDAADKTPTGKAKRRAAKPRRKWSEEETNHLLMGVSKHGVGRWTDILADKEYSFNDRSAGDLKDRFRTCCPEELRANLMAKKEGIRDKQQSAAPSEARPRKGLMSENILNETEEDVAVGTTTTTTTTTEKASPSQSTQQQQQNNNNDSDSAATAAGSRQQQQQQQRKSRAHRKKMEDLAELGIRGPFKKSHRRERRPFSEQDDREILEGFEVYGPQWTKIQRDPRFNLSSRQPTDLRDRLRNKYPERFAAGAGAAEKTTTAAALQAKEVTSSQQQQQTQRQQQGEQSHHQQQQPGPGPHSNNLLEPSVNMVIENSLSAVKSSSAALLEPQLHRTGSREDVPRWPSLFPAAAGCGGGLAAGTEGAAPEPAGGFYWNGTLAAASAAAVIGEMDISRLLLNDDEQFAGEQQQQMPPSSDRRGQG